MVRLYWRTVLIKLAISVLLISVLKYVRISPKVVPFFVHTPVVGKGWV